VVVLMAAPFQRMVELLMTKFEPVTVRVKVELPTTVKVDEIHKRLFAISSFDEISSAVRVAREIVEKS